MSSHPSTSRTAPPNADLAPSTVPPSPSAHYRLGDELARGGMGIVYHATDTVLDRPVAVKVLQDHGAETGRLARRFAEEARITGRLQHPAIPPVHDLGTLPNGRLFLAMKFIEGRTLQELLKERKDLAADRAQFIAAFEQICQGVAYAQSHGVIHRDLKPSNIMVGSFGEIQVMDWGLAKMLGSAPDKTRNAPVSPEQPCSGDPEGTQSQYATNEATEDNTHDGQSLGTPAYMPPEQANGHWEQLGPWSDVFALGGILCAILTGKPPYSSGSNVETLCLAAAGDVRDATRRLGECGADPELVAMAIHCLQPDPKARPTDGAAVAKLVAAYRQGVADRLQKAETERAAIEVKIAEQKKRRRIQLALGMALLLLLAGSGAFAWWQDRQSSEKLRAVQQQEAKDAEALADNTRALSDLLDRCELDLSTERHTGAPALLLEIDRRAAGPGGHDFRERIERCRADLAMLVELDRIDDDRWTVIRNQLLNPAITATQLRKAFADYGIVPETTPPADVATRLKGSPIRERLLGKMEMWHLFQVAPGLVELLESVDPDAIRMSFRKDVQQQDWAQLGTRCQEAVQKSTFVSQPARFIAAFGAFPQISLGVRRQILEQAAARSPGDFGIVMEIAGTHPYGPASAAEKVRWSQAAVALRPDFAGALNSLANALWDLGDLKSAEGYFRLGIQTNAGNVALHLNLGILLGLQGNRPGAIAEYREVLRIDPKHLRALYSLGVALKAEDRLDEAIAVYRELLKLEPNYAPGHNGLGNAYREKGELDAAIAEYREALQIDPKNPQAKANLEDTLKEKAGMMDK